MPELKVKFDTHGLGDACHFAHLLQLYKRRGYDVTVQAEQNKLFVWQVAGVNIVQGGDLPNHGWGYPAGFDDLSQPDWRCNKVAHGINHPPLPRIGDPRQLWDELCQVRLSAHDLIPAEAHAEAERFLAGLPRPIICLHTRGTNWQARKSLSIETAFRLILRLLDETGGSVISLDFDRREPIVADARCKGLLPSWGKISVDRLCALYEQADLMIGVDSGPFHVASFTPIKALGVFHSLHPVRCCLPNPRAAYLVPEKHGEHWDARKTEWRFLRYQGDEPTAEQIAEAAVQVLSGVYSVDYCTPEETAAVAGEYLYRRVGHDQRPMQLLTDGAIGHGAAGCERRWSLRRLDGTVTLTISGDTPTCHLMAGADGVWRGRWLRHEQMPIELIPLRAITERGETAIPARSRGDGLHWAVAPDVRHWDAGLKDHEDWIRRWLPHEPDQVAVDVGAFIGTNALWMAQRCREVYAFEPVAKHAELLESNARLNHLDNVRVIRKAAGAEAGKIRFTSAGMNSHRAEEGDEVELTTLDAELAHLERLDFIKIDVEGDEVNVLRGAGEVLRKFRPELLIEVHSHFPGCEGNGSQIEAILGPLDYSLRRVWENEPGYYYVLATPSLTLFDANEKYR